MLEWAFISVHITEGKDTHVSGNHHLLMGPPKGVELVSAWPCLQWNTERSNLIQGFCSVCSCSTFVFQWCGLIAEFCSIFPILLHKEYLFLFIYFNCMQYILLKSSPGTPAHPHLPIHPISCSFCQKMLINQKEKQSSKLKKHTQKTWTALH